MSDFERKQKKLSIVVPSWFTNDQHGRYGLHETFHIASLCMQRLKEVIDDTCELILIDNGSTLIDEDVADAEHIKLTPSWYWAQADVVIKNKTNLGFAPAINEGANLARGEYILFLNNDIFMWSNFVENLLEIFDHKELEPPVGAVMPNLIKKEFQKDCFREDGRKLDTFKVMALKEEDIVYPHKEIIETGAEFGSAFMMKKELVEEIKKLNGGYEFMLETFKLGMSDDRFCWHQIRKLGYENYRTNRIRCVHVGNLTIGKYPNRKKYTMENREKLKKLIEEDR